MNNGTKDVFLCHNRADKDWVRHLGIRIEAETIDGNVSSRRLSVFFDEWDIDYGENCVNRMNVGLQSARYLVVVISPEFFEFGWTNFEWTDVGAEDPWGVKKKIIPILLRDISGDGSRRIVFPAPFKALRYLDFRDERHFEQEFQKLLRRLRGLPPSRGELAMPRQGPGSIPRVAEEDSESWQPDRIREVILGNMLQVILFPATIWSAATEKQSPAQVRTHTPLAEAHIIRAKRIWTFADLTLESCQLRAVLNTGSISKISSRDWMVDPERTNWWMDLLGQSLTTHLSKLAMKRDDKGRFFFRPNKDGTDRIWKNRNDRSRTVAAKKTNAFDGSTFWVHHAARIRFRLLGERYFLVIEPTYLFTSD